MRRWQTGILAAIAAGALIASSTAQTPATPPGGSPPATTTAPATEKHEASTPPIPAAKPSDAKPSDSSPAGDVGWLRVTGNNVNVRSRPHVNRPAVEGP